MNGLFEPLLNFLRRIKKYICGTPPISGRGFSQEGEDLLLERLIDKQVGFYIDVGAHHPTRFSNTYLFYKKGWHGINIEPLPGSKVLFDELRPRDINIECAIGSKHKECSYFMFNEPALNTFDETDARRKDGLFEGRYFIEREVPVQTTTLSKVLKEIELPETIDFMSIDVEGFELEVLKGNDWHLCRPQFLIIEQLNTAILEVPNTEIFKFLQNLGYQFFAKTHNSSFYRIL